MAGKRRHYILTETAEGDFRAAWQWSLSRWGKALTKQYFTDLHKCAESIAQNHNHCASIESIVDTVELSIYPIREHYLVYVPTSNGCIAIVALIRQTRDVPAVLDANGFLIQRQLKEIFEKLERGAIPNLKK
ncbi:type II toxin-antitoxin system RelE/ParE family toxin [Exilibacterium tricleocarpae]|uniref:Type II toxin-antitoxin system RelE/ParE family toxin n=1 Tax=Exilibacterium tricleocarpae TaxID=2591008 RepID=A0A545TZ17_9GAMM|nr:type II toxin-antitoxin system RelE/ParE family toxin [Exilibacterium tricleocarpae]TQV82433.1 type II toxin-antitoxin system RelE/ParE family toxin [Exilibacterium tricleocarpae]